MVAEERASIELSQLPRQNGGSSSFNVEELLEEQMQPLASTGSKDKMDDSSRRHSAGTASNAQVAVNIIISFVGAGLLGVPHAFQKAGWLLGSVALCTVSALNVYAMLLLPTVRRHLVAQGHYDATNYGAVGRIIMGERGETLVNVSLVVSQMGFATAYVIFIAANLNQICSIPRWIVCYGCVPGLILLTQVRDMKSLSPFSLLANLANLVGLSAVLFQDYEMFHNHKKERNDVIHPVKWGGLLYVIGITLYSMEGIGLILSLESSCKKQTDFPWLLQVVVGLITIFMAIFGSLGYYAFGDHTLAPITLNLQHPTGAIEDDTTRLNPATLVQLALCVALYLTYPVMMFPVWTVAEQNLRDWQRKRQQRRHAALPQAEEGSAATDGDTPKPLPPPPPPPPPSPSSPTTTVPSNKPAKLSLLQRFALRVAVVLFSATIAYRIPNFGEFLSLVGSSLCTLLGFILPPYFYRVVFGTKDVPLWQQGLNNFLMVGGAIFGVVGTLQSIGNLLSGEEEPR